MLRVLIRDSFWYIYI